jgi:hypothetical protein
LSKWKKNEVDLVVGKIRENIEKSKEKVETTNDPISKLKKLKELLDLGINQKEYDEKRQELLKKI